MGVDLRKFVLERARGELAAIAEKCQGAVKAIEQDVAMAVVEALWFLDELDKKLEDARNRLLALRDAEHDFDMSPYLLSPTAHDKASEQNPA
jgi:hypothetical protein